MNLRVCTYNIHKGFSQFNRQLVIHELRERLRAIDADVVFLQEVQGQHERHARRHRDWPSAPQHEFLAHGRWQTALYGGNAVYDHGHHGNAILSRLPVLRWENLDVSEHRFEQRGLLHAELQRGKDEAPLHCLCIHFGLTGGGRRRQLETLARRIESSVPAEAPLLIAGDFNDWRNQADALLARRLGLREVFSGQSHLPARSYPSVLPLLRLDRIYVRGFEVHHAQVHGGPPWSRISDHALICADLRSHPPR